VKTDDTLSLTPRWLAAARTPQIAAALEAIYTIIGDQIESRGPACWASGRCCNFAKAGHRLYATGLETAFLIARLDRAVTREEIDAAVTRGDCPFLTRNLCGVHTIKPVGCRIYFCDESSQEWQHELSERALTMVRALHDQWQVPYRYGEWRAMLGAFAAAADDRVD